MERNIEVIIKPYYQDMPSFGVSPPNINDRVTGGVYALLDIRLINHRTDRRERIIGCYAELKKRRCLLWHKTLATIPVLSNSPTDSDLKYPIKDIVLEPQSKPYNCVINIIGKLNGFEMPKHTKLFLVFEMVGPMRKLTKLLDNISYRPKSREG